MTIRLEQILNTTFRLEESEGENKVTSLADAIKEHVQPGMIIHFGEAANDFACELVRQFQGTRPDFTIIVIMLGEHMAVPIHAGLVKKLISGVVGDFYPGPGPNYIVQRALKAGTLQIENWSLVSLIQRFMAAALDVGFMPTKSLVGSGAADQNKDSFTMVEDPFGSGKKVGAVRALVPDISLFHGWAADHQGNTIIAPGRFSGQDAWGAKAAKKVIVSVEKIVSTDFIRKYSRLVAIPGFMVSAVCPAPLGAHPHAFLNCGVPELGAYGDDFEFMMQQKQASRDPSKYDAWMKEWVLGCPTHEDYLNKLGTEKISFLKSKATPDGWKVEMPSLLPDIPTGPEYNPVEMMIVTGARKITEKVLRNNYKVLLGGFGASSLVAWLAYYKLKEKEYDIGLATASGFYGHAPRPGDSLLTNPATLATCRMMGSALDTSGVFASGAHSSKSMAVFGTAQLDKKGNLNSTLLQGVFITGAGGGGDSFHANEAIAFTKHHKDRFVPEVPFITLPGAKVKTVISTLGVFEKVEGEELILTGYFPDIEHPSPVDYIKENCGWDLKVWPKIEKLPPPSLDELLLLRLLDPRRLCTV